MPGHGPEAPADLRSDGADLEPTVCSWERRREVGFVRGFLLTVREMVFNPGAVFLGTPAKSRWWSPLAFALVAVIIGFVGHTVCILVGDMASGKVSAVGLHPLALLTTFGLRQPLQAASVIIGFVLVFILWALVCHVFLKWRCPQYADFSATWRVICYAQAPAILYILPVVGPSFGHLWFTVLLALGFSETHRTRLDLAVTAFLIASGVSYTLKTAWIMFDFAARGAGSSCGQGLKDFLLFRIFLM